MPSFGDVIHELVNICAKDCAKDVNEITRSVLLKIATSYEIYDEAYDEFQAAIPYLTERRAVDVNALEEPDFSSIMEFLEDKLLHLCSVFSTPSTNVFLHTKLDARKIHLIWTSILQNLPSNLCSGSVDVMRSFVRNGFDVKNALFRVCFSNLFFGTRCFEESFNDLLEILEIFMDHGARLNPLPGSEEQPFLHGVLSVHSEFFDENETRPTLYGFFTKCIKRGVDPKLCSVDWLHDDLLFAVCHYYNADDKNDLIEYLCDCGAGASLYRNNGADLWLLLSCRSGNELAQPRSNEVLLTLLRRGLRTGCVDKDGNNVLHMYFRPYITNNKIEGCCMFVRLCALDNLKFWDVLDALLDAGVPVHHVNNVGETPFDLFKCIIRNILQDDVEPCSQCFKRHCMEGPSSIFVKLKAQLTRVGKYTKRLSPLSFAIN